MNNTLVKGLRLLEELARSDRALGITELSERLGLNKSNVHRMLQSLVELRYVHQDDESSAYRASLRLWEIGVAVLSHFDIRRLAEPFMQRLLQETRETVHLSILDEDEVVYIHKIESPEPVRAYTRIGGRASAWCVATGKAMLAYEDPARLALLASRLTRETEHTITSADEFMSALERVRHKGYAVNRGEWQNGVHGVAAPIRGADRQVIAAVGISGPAERMKVSMFKALGETVILAANGISHEFVHDPGGDAGPSSRGGLRRN